FKFVHIHSKFIGHPFSEFSEICIGLYIHHAGYLCILCKYLLINTHTCEFNKSLYHRTKGCVVGCWCSLGYPCEPFKAITSIHYLQGDLLPAPIREVPVLYEYEGCEFNSTDTYLIAWT